LVTACDTSEQQLPRAMHKPRHNIKPLPTAAGFCFEAAAAAMTHA
jgi:hypothetical protein